MSKFWLMDEKFFNEFTAQIEGANVSADAIEKFEARVSGPSSDLQVSKGVGSIQVKGVLTEKPDFFAMFFGGGNSTYRGIINALDEAEADQDVSSVDMEIDSPGGEASAAWAECMERIKSFSKPIHAKVLNLAASAAFGIASQADTIEVKNKLSMVGSVGVVATYHVNKNVVSITSSGAPDKRPDPSSEEGEGTIRAFIDQIETVFIDSVASGRKVSEEQVRADFGKGGIVLAEEALQVGMIDAIGGRTNEGNENQDTFQTQEKDMDKDTLQAEQPALFAAVLAEGRELGVADEKARVSALSNLGEASGAADLAAKYIKDGKAVDANVMAEFQAESMKAMKALHASGDDADTTKALEGADTEIEAEDAFDKALEAEYGDVLEEV